MTAKVIFDRLIVFKEPGGTTYVTMLYKGDTVNIIKGYAYEERIWKDKQFVQIMTPGGKVGYATIHALTPIKEKSK